MSASMEEWLKSIVEDADFSRFNEWANKQIEKMAKRAKRTIYVPVDDIVPFEKNAMEEGWQKTKEMREKMGKIASHKNGVQK